MDDILKDRANEILVGANISTAQKADAWDAYHDAPSSEHLVNALHQLSLPDEIKQALYDAKRASEYVPPSPEAVVVRTLRTLAEIDPKVLAVAEAHPQLAARFITAGLRGKA